MVRAGVLLPLSPYWWLNHHCADCNHLYHPSIAQQLLHKDEDELNPDVDQDELDSQSALDGYDDFNLIAKNKELADQVYTINHEGGIELPNLHKEADLLKAVRTLASNEPQLTAEVIKDWLEEDLKEKA